MCTFVVVVVAAGQDVVVVARSQRIECTRRIEARVVVVGIVVDNLGLAPVANSIVVVGVKVERRLVLHIALVEQLPIVRVVGFDVASLDASLED